MIAPMSPAVRTRSQVKSFSPSAKGILFYRAQPAGEGVLLAHHVIHLFLNRADISAQFRKLRAYFLSHRILHLPKGKNHGHDRAQGQNRSSYVADCVRVIYLSFHAKNAPTARSIPTNPEVNFQIVVNLESAFSCARAIDFVRLSMISSFSWMAFSACLMLSRICSNSLFNFGFSEINPPI